MISSRLDSPPCLITFASVYRLEVGSVYIFLKLPRLYHKCPSNVFKRAVWNLGVGTRFSSTDFTCVLDGLD